MANTAYYDPFDFGVFDLGTTSVIAGSKIDYATTQNNNN